jgi:predicted alpha/beta superfamily hydrolase
MADQNVNAIMKTISICLAAALALLDAHAQLTMRIRVPAGTPDSSRITVAGTFNGWNPGAAGYVLSPVSHHEYLITLSPEVTGPIAFKFTLGSWETVETDESGRDVRNRAFMVPAGGGSTYAGTVAGWRTVQPGMPRQSTRSSSVSILDTAFRIPQLGRTRRIWLYLPPGYESGGKRYPVVYMHDGQNLFDAATSFAGEWGIDETLDSLRANGDDGCIVVGIDNGGAHRIAEYSPWRNSRYGGGEGDAFLDFVVRALKPYVDAHYRTMPDRLHTAMAGSSLGGNLSLYAGLKFPGIFGRIGVFSPALWFNPALYRCAATAGPPLPGTRLFFIVGTQEGETSEDQLENLNGVRRMVDTLAAAGFRSGTAVDTAFCAGGRHAEGFWRREFVNFYEKLFRPEE